MADTENPVVDYSLLIEGEEVWRWWSADGGYYTSYRRDLGEDIGLLASEVLTHVNHGGNPWPIHADIPKCLRCKSRKRMKKLLMSIGYPARMAEFTASFPAMLRGVDRESHKDKLSLPYLQCSWLMHYFGYVLTPKFSGCRAEIRDNLSIDTATE